MPGFIRKSETFNRSFYIPVKGFFVCKVKNHNFGTIFVLRQGCNLFLPAVCYLSKNGEAIFKRILGGIIVEAFLMVFFIILIAELGDKTQLLVMALASRFKMKDVILGVGAALFVLNLMAVGLGHYLNTKLPLDLISVVAAYLFVAFGLWTLKPSHDDEEAKTGKLPPLIAIALGFFIAELGDKTQITAFAMSAKYGQPLWVFLGAFFGMVVADSLGIIVAVFLGKKIPQDKMALASAWIFVLFGVIGIMNGYKTNTIHFGVMIISLVVIIVIATRLLHKKNNRLLNNELQALNRTRCFDNEIEMKNKRTEKVVSKMQKE